MPRSLTVIAALVGFTAAALGGAACWTNQSINTCDRIIPPDGYCVVNLSYNTCTHATPTATGSHSLLPPVGGHKCTWRRGTLDEEGNCGNPIPPTYEGSETDCQATAGTQDCP
jgi:hypothetical protein